MKKIYLILLLMLGIFLIPESSLACNKTHKKASSKEVVSHNHKKDSCEKNNSCNDNNHKDCKGKCGHSSCLCPVSAISAAVFFNQDVSNPSVFAVAKKSKFYYAAPGFASGFYSIWLRPKIS